ncbi:MAG: hypothetical protein ABJB12_21130 [Pseudomonadota bacterium]
MAGAFALSLVSPVLMSGDVPRVAEIVLGWGLLSVAYVRLGKRLIDDRGIRIAWRQRSWEDITSARVRFGQIALRGARRSLYLPNSSQIRAALQTHAPPEHPLRAALAQRRPQRICVLDVVAALLAIAASAQIAAMAWLWFKDQRRVHQIEQSYQNYSAPFERDLRLASTIDAFKPPFSSPNAAEFLNQRVRWCADSSGSGAHGCVGVDQPGSFLTRDLFQYGYWDILGPSPAGSALSKLAPGDMVARLDLPHPRWADLVACARERLASAAHDARFPEAVREARQLARLAYSTETFVGAAAALAILGAETHLRGKLGRLPEEPDLPVAIPDDTLKAARRALTAYGAFFSPVAPPALRARIFADSQLSFARCAGIAAGIRASLLAHDMLQAPLIFARDYHRDYAEMGHILGSSRAECRLLDERAQWALVAPRVSHFSPVARLLGEGIVASDVALQAAYGGATDRVR